MKKHPVLFALLLFAVTVLTSFCIRTWHYHHSVAALRGMIKDTAIGQKEPRTLRKLFPYYHNNFAPFTIESAMMFTYAKDIAEGKGVPESDPRLAGMEDMAPYAQMNMGLEWFLGWGWKYIGRRFTYPEPTADELRFQDVPAMAQWMSGQLRLWASLTSGFIVLWLLAMRCPWHLSLAGGLLHAVALAAVARATGQDFVRGEFCIPLYTACLALGWSCYNRGAYWKYILLFCCTFLAFVTWDLCQMLFGVWVLCELLRYALGFHISRSRIIAWGVITLAILLNAAFVPFNQAYSLWRAPILWAALPALGCVFLCAKQERLAFFRKKAAARLIPALVLPLMLYGVWSVTINTPEYASNYSHFSEAMSAKLKYRNVKPKDPAKLSYDARILWTPSMHSATWPIAVSFFPSLHFGRKMDFSLFRFLFGYLPATLAFYYALLLGAVFFSIPRHTVFRSARIAMLPHLFTIGYTVGFIYIVRYHEFLILFLSVALPLMLRDFLRAFRYAPEKRRKDEAYTVLYTKKGFLRTIRGILLSAGVFLLFWEAGTSFITKRRYTGDVHFAATARLCEWFRSAGEQVKHKTVAANITIGPMLMAYADTGISMNPQFGIKRLRDATEEYITALFAKDENALLEYCKKYHVKYVIYNNGLLFDISPYSMRYIAAAKDVPPRSPANLMYYAPRKLRWFHPVQPPAGLRSIVSQVYRVYQVIQPEDRKNAALKTFEASDEYRHGSREKAEKLLKEALMLDPASMLAGDLFREIYGRSPQISLDGVH